MREATGNALLMTMMTSIIAIIMIFFVGSISYSKSYRLKNYIINQIEENGGWDDKNKNMTDSLDSYFKKVGYHVKRSDFSCPIVKTNVNNCINQVYNGDYEACIYKCGDYNTYYKVITYMRFDFPVVGNSLKFEVTGETRSFNDFN